MSQYMPSNGFKWVEVTLDGLEELTDTSNNGKVYEVDITYLQHQHTTTTTYRSFRIMMYYQAPKLNNL